MTDTAACSRAVLVNENVVTLAQEASYGDIHAHPNTLQDKL